MKCSPCFAVGAVALALFTLTTSPMHAEAKKIDYFGYNDCILIENQLCRVILSPSRGGKILEYSREGKNVLFQIEEERGRIYDGSQDDSSVSGAGRFDIGPELVIPARPELFIGKWKGKITGDFSARMTSIDHVATGVRLEREFLLDEKSTKLNFTQTMTNISDGTVNRSYWARTFAVGKGLVAIPLSDFSAMPSRYFMHEARGLVNVRPEDPALFVQDDFLIVGPTPEFPKLGMDSMEGWFGYYAPNDLLFLKKFPTYPDRSYVEPGSYTISIWYPKIFREASDEIPIELEPIGPLERLAPGESASFTEEWHLLAKTFPGDAKSLDLAELKREAEGAFGE